MRENLYSQFCVNFLVIFFLQCLKNGKKCCCKFNIKDLWLKIIYTKMYLQSEKKAFWKKVAPLKPSPTYPQVHRKESLNNFYHYHQYYHFFFTKLTTKIATSFIPKWIAIILEYCYHKRASILNFVSLMFSQLAF